jgi:exonuclease III
MALLRIATLNINGISSLTRLTMLEEFIRAWEIDILLNKEITQPSHHTIGEYSLEYNIGTKGSGTAIIARDGIHLENVACLPSGRAIAAKFLDVTLIKIYAPSGSVRRHDGELYHSSE